MQFKTYVNVCVCVACSLAHSYVRYFEFIVFNSF